jgi:hypothetical protein
MFFYILFWFSYNLPADTISSVLKIKFFAKILCSNFIVQALFQSAQHFVRKGKDPELDPKSDPYLWLIDRPALLNHAEILRCANILARHM